MCSVAIELLLKCNVEKKNRQKNQADIPFQILSMIDNNALEFNQARLGGGGEGGGEWGGFSRVLKLKMKMKNKKPINNVIGR